MLSSGARTAVAWFSVALRRIPDGEAQSSFLEACIVQQPQLLDAPHLSNSAFSWVRRVVCSRSTPRTSFPLVHLGRPLHGLPAEIRRAARECLPVGSANRCLPGTAIRRRPVAGKYRCRYDSLFTFSDEATGLLILQLPEV